MKTLDFQFIQPDTQPCKLQALEDHVRSEWVRIGFEQISARIMSVLLEWAIANHYYMDVEECTGAVTFTHASLIPIHQ